MDSPKTPPEFEPIQVDHYWGHVHHVTALLVLNNGSCVITGCADGIIRVFMKDKPHTLVAQVKVHLEGQVNCLTTSENDSLIASAGHDRAIALIRFADMTVLKTFKNHRKQITDVKISKDVKTLCSVGWDKRINLYDIQKLRKILTLTIDGTPLSCCAFSFKNNMVATGTWGGLVKVFPVNKLPKITEEDATTLNDHKSKITSIAFSRAGMMATGSYDSQVHIYHYRGFYSLFSFCPDGGWVRSMAFSPDSLLLATLTDADFMVKCWDAVTQELEFSYQISINSPKKVSWSF
ncbi:WD repeat-containing protein 38-like isoform X2 [Symsagittifera roscoffensis]|uniref:WD repeat-containing protein 38-like isoform X2 n=1 Tax=Symsagittifera roscoffensis TaxID=84072 RepID=UPI00307BC9E9